MRVGVLAVQGGFSAQQRWLRLRGHEVQLLHNAEAMNRTSLDALVLPGGESPVQMRLLKSQGLEKPIFEFLHSGLPVFCTCAGLILCANQVIPEQWSFQVIDIRVLRNGFGPQTESAEALDDSGSRQLLFIRAPRVTQVGSAVEVLATYQGEPILVRQGSILGATYHPELLPEEDPALPHPW